jgi:hypothetical protein
MTLQIVGIVAVMTSAGLMGLVGVALNLKVFLAWFLGVAGGLMYGVGMYVS